MRGFVRRQERGGSVRWNPITTSSDGGQQSHGGFARKKDAQARLREVLSQKDAGAYVEPSKQTLGEWLEQWLTTLRTRGLVKPSTLKSYEHYARHHVVPHLGSVRLQALSAAHLDRLYTELLEAGRMDGRSRGGKRGLSNRSVHYCHAIVHKALADALRAGLVTHNVADRATPPRPPRPAPEAWTAEQLRTFLTSTADERDAALWRLAAMTGMRRGELLALRWADVDLDRSTVTVVDGKRPRSRRTIDIDDATVAALRSHRARQAASQLAGGPLYRTSDLVFTREDGRALDQDSVSKRFVRLAKAAELPRIRFHDLRGTHATLLLKAGVPLHVVSRRLGHASEAFTAQRYASVLPQQAADAAATFAAAVDGEAR